MRSMERLWLGSTTGDLGEDRTESGTRVCWDDKYCKEDSAEGQCTSTITAHKLMESEWWCDRFIACVIKCVTGPSTGLINDSSSHRSDGELTVTFDSQFWDEWSTEFYVPIPMRKLSSPAIVALPWLTVILHGLREQISGRSAREPNYPNKHKEGFRRSATTRLKSSFNSCSTLFVGL